MEQGKDVNDLAQMVFDIMTEEYKEKVDTNKDLKDYLNEKTKQDLLSIYLLYGYAENNEYIVEEIVELQRKKKGEVIDRIITLLDSKIHLILGFLNEKRMSDLKDIARREEIFTFGKHDGNDVSFDTIKILRQLGFIFCKKDKKDIVIHMPKYIRDKINSVNGKLRLEFYDKIILYSKGIANTYGAIHLTDAYDIIKNDVLISFEKYDSIIKFVSLLELEPIYYSFEYQCLCDFNIHDEDIIKIFESREDIVVYNREMYEDIGNDKYLMNLKEYKEFRNFLKEYYWFDINEDELLRGEIVDDYIDSAQFDEKEAISNVKEALDRYFDINESEKIEIINYINRIRKKMPIWKQGGRIDNTIQFPKVGRNEPCPCRIR